MSERTRETPAGDALDVATEERLWRGVVAARAQKKRRGAIARAAGGIAVGCTAVAAFAVHGARHPIVDARGLAANAPLRLAAGDAIADLAADEGTRSFTFDDASHVDLARGAHLDVRANTAQTFVASLHGAATFEVTPGGARRWSIACGDVTVDVIGTRFRVEEDATRVHVAVEHGIVVVRGERVVDHARRLVDGESIDVGDPRVAANGSLEAADAGVAIDPAPRATAPTAPPSPSAWRVLAQRGDYAAAYDALPGPGQHDVIAHASVDELFARADVARLSAHPAEALAPLTEIVEAHPNDPRASLAAFTRGRVELDALANPAGAAASFTRAIALGLPRGLDEDAYVRLVEADARAGDHAAARAAADAYAAKFPNGSRRAAITRWLGGE